MDTKFLGHVPYLPTWEAMQAFTAERSADTTDQLWLCEHPPTFTQGLAGRAEHVLGAGDIPVVATNRGGQVTYHGPGQVVAYPLVNLQRAGYYVKEFVYRTEEAVLRTLAHYGVTGHRVAGAPGIYVRLEDPGSHAMLEQRPQHGVSSGAHNDPDFTGLGKIAALGLSPFDRIHPCGYAALKTVDLSTIGVQTTWEDAARFLGQQLTNRLAP